MLAMIRVTVGRVVRCARLLPMQKSGQFAYKNDSRPDKTSSHGAGLRAQAYRLGSNTGRETSCKEEADMELYAGIDLHSNNSMVVVLDETDRVVHRKRLPNNLDGIISALRSCAGQIQGVAVESTFNWYWLVDGLQEAGYVVHLVEHGSGQAV